MRKQGARAREAGFTLVEALTAIVILIFGLMAVTNLMIVAASSNQIANQTTASAAVAAQVMENLKATAWHSLVPGGTNIVDAPGQRVCTLDVGATASVCDSSLTPGVYNCDQDVPGVGRIHARWSIVPVSGQSQLLKIVVCARASAALGGDRTLTWLETFRSCTSPLFDANGTCSFPPIMTPTGLQPSCCPNPP